jgi:hypothetical protein
MKQDTNYTTSNDNITAMTKTVEYFAEYLLEEIKKSTEGKKKLMLLISMKLSTAIKIPIGFLIVLSIKEISKTKPQQKYHHIKRPHLSHYNTP